MRIRLRTLAALGLAALPAACGNGGGDEGGNGASERSRGPTVHGDTSTLPALESRDPLGAPHFAGLGGVAPAEDRIHLRWRPAADDRDPPEALRYRLYLAEHSEPIDYSHPTFETAPGATSAVVRLAPGRTYAFVLRAVDTEGHEDGNCRELMASTYPVRYVDARAAEGGDGSGPDRPLRRVREAVESALFLDGLNVWIAAGSYEERLVLFEGMALYGGFDSAFDPMAREFGNPSTVLRGESRGDLVVVAPGNKQTVLDGLDLDGAGKASRGLVVDDVRLVVHDCRIHDFVRRGVELRGEEDEFSQVRVRFDGVQVDGNQGEGVSVRGIAALRMHDCDIHHNRGEGIEVDPLSVGGKRTSRVWVEECHVHHNEDVGVDVKFRALPDGIAGSGEERGEVELLLSRTRVEDNADHGASLDTDPLEEWIPLSVRVEDCRFARNGKCGLSIDADVGAEFLVDRCVFRENAEAGLRVSGDAERAWIEVRGGASFDNRGAGLELRDRIGVDADLSTFGNERVLRMESPRTALRLRGVEIWSEDAASDPELSTEAQTALRAGEVGEPLPRAVPAPAVLGGPFALAPPPGSALSSSELRLWWPPQLQRADFGGDWQRSDESGGEARIGLEFLREGDAWRCPRSFLPTPDEVLVLELWRRTGPSTEARRRYVYRGASDAADPRGIPALPAELRSSVRSLPASGSFRPEGDQTLLVVVDLMSLPAGDEASAVRCTVADRSVVVDREHPVATLECPAPARETLTWRLEAVDGSSLGQVRLLLRDRDGAPCR